MKFIVSYREMIDADDAAAAAREFDRLLKTTRPMTYDVTPRGPALGGTVFVRVKANADVERVA